MSIVAKIKHQWGYDCGPLPPAVVLSGGGTVIDHWPDDSPPTIEEIEAVELPGPTPTPDWAAFRLALVQSSAYIRITSAAPNALVALLTNIAFLIDSQPEKAIELAAIWNVIATIATPTESEIAALNAIGTTTHVPFSLNASGLME